MYTHNSGGLILLKKIEKNIEKQKDISSVHNKQQFIKQNAIQYYKNSDDHYMWTLYKHI